MDKSYRIHLDVCCLNRPFDDWTQERVRLEGESVIGIITQVSTKGWQIINSEAIEVELQRMSNLDKLQNILSLLKMSSIYVNIDEIIENRSRTLEDLGFTLYDSYHIACSEIAKADILLTTDDRLLRKAITYESNLMVKLSNPVTWLMNIFQLEGESSNDTN